MIHIPNSVSKKRLACKCGFGYLERGLLCQGKFMPELKGSDLPNDPDCVTSGHESARQDHRHARHLLQMALDGERVLAEGRGGHCQATLDELGGFARPNETESEADPARDRKIIQRWAAHHDAIIPADDFLRFEELGGRSEHDIFQDAAEPGYLYKRWKDKPWFPREYLSRWLLSDLLFGDRADLAGLTHHPESGRMVPVIRQPIYEGTHPLDHEVDIRMEAAGFRKIGLGQYLHDDLGLEVNDAEGHNWIRTPEGLLFPIDVIPSLKAS